VYTQKAIGSYSLIFRKLIFLYAADKQRHIWIALIVWVLITCLFKHLC
jgi:hypothetical protein